MVTSGRSPAARSRSLDADDVAEIMAGLEAGFSSDPAAGSVAVVLGEGAKVNVFGGQLRVVDGVGWIRRTRTWSRLRTMTSIAVEGVADAPTPQTAVGKLGRLVVAAGSGYVSLDAVSWCRELGVALIVLDEAMSVHLAPAEGSVDGRLLRLQAAPPEGLEVEACRLLLRPKLAGQAAVARGLLGSQATADTIESLGESLGGADSVDAARQLEAVAAACYFEPWVNSPATELRFRRADLSRVPSHWLSFDGRRSDLTRGTSNRKASRPLNAMLNYSYAVAAIEARLAAVAVGLSPALGFLHLDAAGREALVWDLVEPVRPVVDRFILDLVAERTFARGDFVERSDGSVAISGWLRQRLTRELPAFARTVAPHAEALVHLLGRAMTGKFTAATPLSGERSKAAAALVKARKGQGTTAGALKPPPPARDTSCIRCGAPVAPRRMYCPECQETHIPGQSAAARSRRTVAIVAARARERQVEAWQPIREGLAEVLLSRIAEDCGVTKGTASRWRRGLTTPDLCYWPALAALAGVELVGVAERIDPNDPAAPREYAVSGLKGK